MKLAVCLSLLLLLVGCAAAPIALNGGDKSLRGKTISIQVGEGSSFNVMTGGQAMLFGTIGMLASPARGAKLTKDNNVPDPSIGLADKLAARLAASYGLTRSSANGDVTLHVNTDYWGMIYFLTDMNNYQIRMFFAVDLTDNKTGLKIASGRCQYHPKYDNTNDAPSWKGLFDDQAVGLKEEIQKAQDFCVGQFMSQTFAK